MSGLQRPRIRTVTVQIEDYDDQVLRFTYQAELPNTAPDPEAGLEVEMETQSDRGEAGDPFGYDPFGPVRAGRMRHACRLVIEKARTYSVEIVRPPATADVGPDELEGATVAPPAGEA